jgi:NADH dehydrogenase
MHRVVIVGGGFGGLNAARALRHAPVEVTLIDRRNFHLFQPLLYQVATGQLSPAEIASPIRNILHDQENTRVLLGEVDDFDVAARCVILNDGTRTPYDSLIVATGSTDTYFGHDDWEKVAPPLKSIEDATEVRRRILFAFEAAERETDPQKQREWLTFVLVGGGPTGVELAGALSEIANDTLKHDFRNINPRDAQIILIEGMERILQTFPEDLSKSAERALLKRGVQTRAHCRVTNITCAGVTLKTASGEEQSIPCKTILWAAGVRASSLGKALADKTGAQLTKNGGVTVEPDCTVKGHPEIFVIGDLQTFTHQTGKPLPGVAQTALQTGRYAAKTIIRRLKNQQVKPFRYFDKGSLAVIGRLSGVAEIGKLHLSGAPAWFVWLFVHIAYLIGFSNRIIVITQWALSYVTLNRSARLITGKPLPLPDIAPAVSSLRQADEPRA